MVGVVRARGTVGGEGAGGGEGGEDAGGRGHALAAVNATHE